MSLFLFLSSSLLHCGFTLSLSNCCFPMQRKRPLAQTTSQTADEMAPHKAQFKSKPVPPTQESYHKILSVHSIHQRILRQALLQEQKPSSQKIQATVPLDSPETTELLQCISECLMEISHRNRLMEIELRRFREQPEEHQQVRSHTDASAEEATLPAAEVQGDTPEAFDQANLPNQKSDAVDQVTLDAVQYVPAQQLEEREADEASQGRGLLNSQVKQKKALLALRNGLVDVRTQIQAARKGLMEG